MAKKEISLKTGVPYIITWVDGTSSEFTIVGGFPRMCTIKDKEGLFDFEKLGSMPHISIVEKVPN